MFTEASNAASMASFFSAIYKIFEVNVPGTTVTFAGILVGFFVVSVIVGVLRLLLHVNGTVDGMSSLNARFGRNARAKSKARKAGAK